MKKLKKDIQHISDFVRHDLWRTTTEELDNSRRFGLQTLKTLIIATRGFNENDISMRANSLTYSFMFAVVPILALFLAVARGFGFEHVIESQLKNSFVGQYDEELVDVIMGFVQRYLETAQGGVFLGIGILILLWAVYSFFLNVESSFNKIWQVHKTRAPGIETHKQNFTRFLVVDDSLEVPSADINKAVLCFTLPHKPGSLAQILTILSFYEMNLTRIQSLPIPGRQWQYFFYADIKFSSLERYRQALQAVRPLLEDVQILGEYKAAL